jgi:hypothetical protein
MKPSKSKNRNQAYVGDRAFAWKIETLIVMADSSSVANTISAQGAGEVDAEATTEADGGRPGRD